MSCIVRNRPGMLQYGAADQMHTPGYCEQQIVDDCERSGISTEEFAQNKIVLSFLDEGFGPAEIAPLTDILLHSHLDRFIVLFNAHVAVDQLPYPARCFTAFMFVTQAYPEPSKTCTFLFGQHRTRHS